MTGLACLQDFFIPATVFIIHRVPEDHGDKGVDRHWMIAASVDMEIRGLRKRLGRLSRERISKGKAWSGTFDGEPLWLILTGVGPACTGKTVEPLLRSGRFRGILSIGYAGALQPSYKVGDIVIPEEVRPLFSLGKGSYQPDPDLVRSISEAAQRKGHLFHTERMLTSDRVITSAEEKRDLGKTHLAGSVEMESSVLADLARKTSLPFLVVRVISDEASFALPDDMVFLQYWRQRNLVRMMAYLFGKPVQMIRLLRLFHCARKASKSLTQFLATCVLDEGILK